MLAPLSDLSAGMFPASVISTTALEEVFGMYPNACSVYLKIGSGLSDHGHDKRENLTSALPFFFTACLSSLASLTSPMAASRVAASDVFIFPMTATFGCI